jgi:hypothetical protein
MFRYFRKTQTGGRFLFFRLLAPFFIGLHILNPAFPLRENIHFIRVCLTALLRPDSKRVSYDCQVGS